MRRGCMSVGDSTCDDCGRVIKHPEQYLAMDEEDILPEDDIEQHIKREKPERFAELKGKHGPMRLCVGCASKRGYGSRQGGVPEKSLTFFEKRADM
jgi:hypothetical protein